MRVRTLPGFLVGKREAILEVAGEKRAVWVGLLFVVAAGLAREYDQEDLLREPWHLGIPVAASVGLSLVLYVLVRMAMRPRGEYERPGFWRGYRQFLGLFWMTAPMALLYGIPWERMLGVGDAVRANLWTLGIVAAWRVVLMSRVIGVITGTRMVAGFILVMVVADGVAIAALRLVPLPIVQIMGGIRLTEGEMLVADITFFATILTFISFPLWAIAAVAVLYGQQMEWRPVDRTGGESGRGLAWLAAASVAVWGMALPWTQQEQRLRSEVERVMREGRIGDGLALMSGHSQEEFPPLWDPPPRLAYGEDRPELLGVLEMIAERGAAPWVREAYVEKLDRAFRWWTWDTEQDRAGQWSRLVRVLDGIPEARALKKKHADEMNEFAPSTDATSRPAGDVGGGS